MLLSAALATALRPRIIMADELPPINLATMIPVVIEEWHEEANYAAQVINPQQQETLARIYNQTLSRTYVNPQGYRIMLSIAYGKNQSDALQLHKPEVCYPAQGFRLINKKATTLDLLGKNISVVRMETSLGRRIEPVTYWTVVGDRIVTGQISKKIAEMRYAMLDRIPDGMLVRVSSIDTNTEFARQMQNQFASQMMGSIAKENRGRFGVSEVAQ